MASYTHKRKEYRITAFPLKYAITLSNGMRGEPGDFFVCDEEGEQYILPKERMERDYDDIMKVNVSVNPPFTLIQTLGSTGSSFNINPSRYSANESE